MKKQMTVDGNEACAYTAYMFTEIAGIYPITPSSPMAEHIDEWSAEGRKNLFHDKVKVVEMQSEAGAIGLVHGALQTGLLTTTFTASQGLLLMIPNMYKIAGELLPCVIHVAARSLSTHALSIFGDHQDIYATRMTGFAMLASSSTQDATYLSAVAHLSSIESSIPFLHFFDGFRTSHEIQKIDVLEQEDYADLLNHEALEQFRRRALNPNHPMTRGTNQNDDIYFQATEVRNPFYDKVPSIVASYMDKINEKAGTHYAPFTYYGDTKATDVIVAMGSICECVKETIDALREKGEKVGLIEVHLYRPFSKEYFLKVLPKTVQRIAVLDRTKEAGSIGEPLYLDIVMALKDKNIKVIGGRYGLSSKNTTPREVKAIYDNLKGEMKHPFTVGLIDDTTHLSLDVDTNFQIKEKDSMLIYGYGSDGMVSAAKSIIKMKGKKEGTYVQGYFQYDSKKSGGVTVSHLRFDEKPIRSTYYVENPRIVVVSKDSYLCEFDTLSNIQENGIFLLNTTKGKEEVLNWLSPKIKTLLKERNIQFYIINAYELARKTGLKNKISMIMESAILRLGNLLPYEEALEILKQYITDEFSKKGEEIVKANIDAIKGVNDYLKQVDISEIKEIEIEEIDTPKSVFEAMIRRLGNMLPTSSFAKYPDGSFESGMSSIEKKGLSDIVPFWVKENCIQCNQCSFVCPHGVIRPFLLSEREYEASPDFIKERAVKPIEPALKDYYYVMAISILNCTGCGLCIKTCPGKKNEKALITKDIIKAKLEHEQEIADYLMNHITEKEGINDNTIKGSQFKKARFFFHGACAGCGETAYIRLLTQLFGSHLVIANATGCSSIYGGSVPETPYTVPWASSLFEDNAEYGYGMMIATNTMRNKLEILMRNHMDNPNHEWFQKWIENKDDFEITKDVYEHLDNKTLPKEILELKEYIPSRTIWTIGGDGWAYDIGYGGIDHVLASGDDVNILVLDTEVYSNTGGQASKATPKGSIAAFATSGKKQARKDLARMALSYPDVYVAQVNLASHPMQLIKAFKEAASYHGPSIIIAYASCIAHGILGGMENSLSLEKMATDVGHFPTFRYNPINKKFILDSKKVNFDQYEEYLNSQTRYRMLKKVNPVHAEELLKENKENAIARFTYYQKLEGE